MEGKQLKQHNIVCESDVEFDEQEQNINEQTRKWRDLPFAIAYYISLIISIVLAIYFFGKMNNDDNDQDDPKLSFKLNFLQICLGVLTGIVFTAIWLAIIIKFAECIIKTSLILTPIFLLIIAIFTMMSSVILGIFMIIGAAFSAYYAYCVWNRVQFAAVCLRIVVEVFKEFWSPILVNIAMSGISIMLLMIDMTAMTGAANEISSSGLQLFVLFFLFLLIYWHNIVTINVAHVTSCGVMGTWFYSDLEDKVTANSFKRAVTTSFGSICFGALIEAAVRALQAIVKMLQDRNRDNTVICVLLCILRCILDCIGDIINYLNSYTFVYVALYGTGYIQSAKDLWNMFKSKGIEALINDDLTTIPLWVGGVINILLIILVCVLIGDFNMNIIIAALFGLVIYFCCVYTLISYTKTLFVCWINDPATFSNHRPEKFKQMVDAANQFGYNTQFCQQQQRQQV